MKNFSGTADRAVFPEPATYAVLMTHNAKGLYIGDLDACVRVVSLYDDLEKAKHEVSWINSQERSSAVAVVAETKFQLWSDDEKEGA